MKIKFILIITLFSGLSFCQVGLQSKYTGGVSQQTLIGQTWQTINTDFDGTYRIWYFMNDTQIVNNIRGSIMYYEWEPYIINGTVNANPANQAVFRLSSSSPGGVLYQYMLVWFIDAAGTQAVFQVYVSPQDITRFLVNEQYAVTQPNFEKIIK